MIPLFCTHHTYWYKHLTEVEKKLFESVMNECDGKVTKEVWWMDGQMPDKKSPIYTLSQKKKRKKKCDEKVRRTMNRQKPDKKKIPKCLICQRQATQIGNPWVSAMLCRQHKNSSQNCFDQFPITSTFIKPLLCCLKPDFFPCCHRMTSLMSNTYNNVRGDKWLG